MKKQFLRHGDLNFHPISEKEYQKFLGKTIKHSGAYIVGRGEATGSTHNIAVQDIADMEIKEDGEVRMVKLLKEAQISHTHDHQTITFQPGYYIQVQERECDHFSKSVVRKIID